MTKISTLFYLVDNTGNEENTEIAGRLLEMEYSELLDSMKKYSELPSDALINKTLDMIKYM